MKYQVLFLLLAITLPAQTLKAAFSHQFKSTTSEVKAPDDERICEFHFLAEDEEGYFFLARCAKEQFFGTLKKDLYIIHYSRSTKKSDAVISCNMIDIETLKFGWALEWHGKVFIAMTNYNKLKNKNHGVEYTSLFSFDKNAKSFSRITEDLNNLAALDHEFPRYAYIDTSDDGQLLTLVALSFDSKMGSTAFQYMVVDENLVVVSKGAVGSDVSLKYVNYVNDIDINLTDKGIISILINPVRLLENKSYDNSHLFVLNGKSGLKHHQFEAVDGEILGAYFMKSATGESYIMTGISHPKISHLRAIEIFALDEGDMGKSIKKIELPVKAMFQYVKENQQDNLIKSYDGGLYAKMVKIEMWNNYLIGDRTAIIFTRYWLKNEYETLICQLDENFDFIAISAIPSHDIAIIPTPQLLAVEYYDAAENVNLDNVSLTVNTVFVSAKEVPMISVTNGDGKTVARQALGNGDERTYGEVRFVPNTFGYSKNHKVLFGLISLSKENDSILYEWKP